MLLAEVCVSLRIGIAESGWGALAELCGSLRAGVAGGIASQDWGIPRGTPCAMSSKKH